MPWPTCGMLRSIPWTYWRTPWWRCAAVYRSRALPGCDALTPAPHRVRSVWRRRAFSSDEDYHEGDPLRALRPARRCDRRPTELRALRTARRHKACAAGAAGPGGYGGGEPLAPSARPAAALVCPAPVRFYRGDGWARRRGVPRGSPHPGIPAELARLDGDRLRGG